MTAVAFDTLKLAEKLHGAGFTRKQASGAAEALSEALAESYSSKLATTEAVETLGRAIDRRFASLETKADQQGAVLAQHGEALAQHGGALARIETLLAKVLDGQAVLHQNDMELKRRLDERKS